jgi:hypothetical protein
MSQRFIACVVPLVGEKTGVRMDFLGVFHVESLDSMAAFLDRIHHATDKQLKPCACHLFI